MARRETASAPAAPPSGSPESVRAAAATLAQAIGLCRAAGYVVEARFTERDLAGIAISETAATGRGKALPPPAVPPGQAVPEVPAAGPAPADGTDV